MGAKSGHIGQKPNGDTLRRISAHRCLDRAIAATLPESLRTTPELHMGVQTYQLCDFQSRLGGPDGPVANDPIGFCRMNGKIGRDLRFGFDLHLGDSRWRAHPVR